MFEEKPEQLMQKERPGLSFTNAPLLSRHMIILYVMQRQANATDDRWSYSIRSISLSFKKHPYRSGATAVPTGTDLSDESCESAR